MQRRVRSPNCGWVGAKSPKLLVKIQCNWHIWPFQAYYFPMKFSFPQICQFRSPKSGVGGWGPMFWTKVLKAMFFWNFPEKRRKKRDVVCDLKPHWLAWNRGPCVWPLRTTTLYLCGQRGKSKSGFGKHHLIYLISCGGGTGWHDEGILLLWRLWNFTTLTNTFGALWSVQPLFWSTTLPSKPMNRQLHFKCNWSNLTDV